MIADKYRGIAFALSEEVVGYIAQWLDEDPYFTTTDARAILKAIPEAVKDLVGQPNDYDAVPGNIKSLTDILLAEFFEEIGNAFHKRELNSFDVLALGYGLCSDVLEVYPSWCDERSDV